MLLSQDRRRDQYADLTPRGDGPESRPQRDFRLAEPYVADEKAVHRKGADGAGPASETERHTKRNQWLKAPQANSHQPGIWRMGVGSHRAPGRRCTGGRGTPGSEDVAGREAVTYVRGAVTAKVQGHNWVPIPSTDHMVSAGNPAAGSRPGSAAGRARADRFVADRRRWRGAEDP